MTNWARGGNSRVGNGIGLLFFTWVYENVEIYRKIVKALKLL